MKLWQRPRGAQIVIIRCKKNYRAQRVYDGVWNANTVLCQPLSVYAVHFTLYAVHFALYAVPFILYALLFL